LRRAAAGFRVSFGAGRRRSARRIYYPEEKQHGEEAQRRNNKIKPTTLHTISLSPVF
jgi:hypothetical protein